MATKQAVVKVIAAMEAAYNKDVPTALADVFIDDLAEVSDDDLFQAASLHRRDPERGRFFPTVADLIAKLPTGMQHPGADVAWAACVKSFDESDTILWTDEIAQARVAALPVWNIGDKVGARMAFKGAYEAILARLPARAIPKWQISGGSNPQARLDAVSRAQAQGLISQKQADQLLPHWVKPIAPEGKAIVAMLTGNNPNLLTHSQPEATIQDFRAFALQAKKARAAMLLQLEQREAAVEAERISDRDDRAARIAAAEEYFARKSKEASK